MWQSFPDMLFFRRYIDDCLMCFPMSRTPSGVQACAVADSWHPSLFFECSGHGEKAHFLDVWLWFERGAVAWSLFEKPQNQHLYLMWDSNHPASTFKSLAIGAFLRCHRRNKFDRDVVCHEHKVLRRLRARGYPLDLLRAAQHDARQRHLHHLHHKRPKSTVQSNFFMKLKFDGRVQQHRLKSHIRRLLPLVQKYNINAVHYSWKVGKNMFRIRYPDTWAREPG